MGTAPKTVVKKKCVVNVSNQLRALERQIIDKKTKNNYNKINGRIIYRIAKSITSVTPITKYTTEEMR